MTEYKNKFDLDGRLHPQRGVTPAKVAEVQRILEKALRGDDFANAELKKRVLKEAYSSSDLGPAIAHLVNLTVIPQLDKAQYSATDLATTRTVPDFDPAMLYSLYGSLTGPAVAAGGGLVHVPEGTPYPKVTVTGQESFYSKLAKVGASFDFTWEASLKDTTGFFASLPQEVVQLAQDSAYREVIDAILSSDTHLAGGSLPNDVTVPADAPVSPDAIWSAKRQMTMTQINGAYIGELSGYNVIVPVGTKSLVDYQLNRQIIEVSDGNLTLSGSSYYQGSLGNVTVLESPALSGTAWAFTPKPGATRRPSIELLKLRGYENPELRVRDGGAESYDDDVRSFRVRFAVGGALWDDSYAILSDGDGEA